MKQRIDEYTVPANNDPATIADVFSIVVTTTNKETGQVHNRIVHLNGNIADKLQQYKDATGKDWDGFGEQVFGIYEEVADVSLDLNTKLERIISVPDKETQEEIDRLTEKAECYLNENETTKTRTKLVSVVAARNSTEFIQE